MRRRLTGLHGAVESLARVLLIGLVGASAAGQSALPPAFVENRGQYPADDRFVYASDGFVVRPREDGCWIQLQQPVAAEESPGAFEGVFVGLRFGRRSGLVAGEPASGSRHTLRGQDRGAWVRDAPAYRSVRLPQGSDSDLTVTAIRGGVILTWTLARGDRLEDLAIDVLGASPRDAVGGGLELSHELGEIQWSAATVRSVQGGLLERAHPVRLGERRVLPAGPGAYSEAVVVETALYFSTHFGAQAELGSNADAIAIGADGRVVIAGFTGSTDLPVTPGAFDEEFTTDRFFLFTDAFVALFDPLGALDFATYLGGTGPDRPIGADVMADGSIVVGCSTGSADYPTTDDSTFTRPALTRLSPDGSKLVWSTFAGAGGVTNDLIEDMAVDESDVVILGNTANPEYQASLPKLGTGAPGQSAGDAYVARYDVNTLALKHSVLIGGSGNDGGTDIALGPDGDVAIVFVATSDGFPVTANALDGTPPAPFESDDAVVVLSADGQSLIFSSYLWWGGQVSFDPVWDVDLARSGGLVLVGGSSSGEVPTTPGVVQPDPSGPDDLDGWVAVVDPVAGSVIHQSYVGSLGPDSLFHVAVDASGVITALGRNTSPGPYPVTPGAAIPETGDVFHEDPVIIRLTPGLERILYASFVGGSNREGHNTLALAIGPDGRAGVTMWTESTDYPTTAGAFEPTSDGDNAAVTVLTMLPQGITRYGDWTSVDDAPIALGVGSWAAVGQGDFALTCSGAPASSSDGMLVVSTGALVSPMQAGGADLWVDPAFASRVAGILSDQAGFVLLDLPLPDEAALAGLTVFVQMVWPGAGPDGGLAASNALAVTVQP